MEGSTETQKYGFIEKFAPKYIWDPAYLLPKNMDNNFHKKMGRHKQFQVQQCLVQLGPRLIRFYNFSVSGNNFQRFWVVLFYRVHTRPGNPGNFPEFCFVLEKS